MRRIAWRVVAAVGLAAACGPLTGCLLIERLPYQIDPGETGYAQDLGYIGQRFVYPLPIVERAMVEAMTDMKMHTVRRGVGKEGNVVMLNGLLYDGRIIAVALEPQGEATGVRIRIDLYGDEPKSRILLDRTAARIAMMTQSVNSPFDTRSLSDAATHRRDEGRVK